MKTALLIYILGVLPAVFFSQSNRETAVRQIESLQKGFLLVRLKTGDLQLKALENAGRKEEAEVLSRKLQRENKELVTAFRSKFHFCPVYFCYSSSSDNIRDGKLAGCLLNDQLRPDSAITPPPLPFLTAELGFTSKQQVEGLIVMDTNFEQLQSPFPFLAKKFNGVAHKRTPEEMVIQLDLELHNFLQKK
jgi:hypothetical protein